MLQRAMPTAAGMRRILDALRAIGAECADTHSFALAGVRELAALIPADLSTLVVCDLATGHRRVVPQGLVSRHAVEVFDLHFHGHPLVRAHGRNPRAQTRSIGELVGSVQFRASPLFHEYYRPLRLDDAIALPLHVDSRWLVSFVLNRGGRAFDAGERACAELLRPHLANLYRLALAAERARGRAGEAAPVAAPPALTRREREVLGWVAAGKTNRDIGAIVGASPRTVEKHLERIYAKLGVETRTAAVMRAIEALRPEP